VTLPLHGLFADALAFAREHLGCPYVSVDVTEPGAFGYAVSIACACGARMLRWVDTEQAERELRANAMLVDGNRGGATR
jgi:hypothetical protein